MTGERKRAQELDLEVLYFEGCPNHAPTIERVRGVLQSEGQHTEVREIEVRTQAEAEAHSFLGSPSVRINGRDIEPGARNLTNYGLSCRTYLEEATRSGVPSVDLIRHAVNEQVTNGSTQQTSNGYESCCPVHEAPSVNISQVSKPLSNRSGSGALFAGGLAAILASTCCLGPLLLVTVGISGAWIGNLTRLEPYRPVFVVIALVALFFAWRSIYRPALECKPGQVCALPQTRRLYKFIFWITCLLTLLALLYPYFLKYFY